MRIRKTSILLAMVFVWQLAATAQASTQATARKAGEANAPQDVYTFEAVTVTAQKQKQDIKDVAASIDAFSGLQVEDSGVDSVKELLKFMPNVFGQENYGINRIVIRGVRSPDSLLFSPSAFYVDDVPYMIAEMRDPDLFNVQSVEVLKGPQGTLYGGNSETGVINIVTRRPGNEFGGSVTGGYGSYNTVKFKADVNVPLIAEKLFFNLAVSSRTSDGYVENEYDDTDGARTDHKNVRGALRLEATDRLSIDFVASAMKYDDQDGSFRLEGGLYGNDRYKIDWDGPNQNDREGNAQSLRLNYEGDDFSFVSVTTRNHFTHDYDGDADLTPYDQMVYAIDKSIEGYTQEFRVSSPENNGPWKWLGGVFGSTQDIDSDLTRTFNIIPGGMESIRDAKVIADNAAAFGEVTYTLWDRLHLSGGLRLDYSQQQGKQDVQTVMGGYSIPVSNLDEHLYQTELLPKISLAYDITDEAMVYALVSKGYLPGGFNVAFANTPDEFIYESEKMWNYEVGVKTSWLDDRLQMSASAFWLEIEDKQVTETLGTTRWINNADKSRSRGVEFEVKARPAHGWDVFAGLGFQDAHFVEWELPSAGGGYDFADNDIPFSPRYTYNAGVQYRHPWGIFSRLDMTGRSDFYTDVKNEHKCDGYQVFNFRLGYEMEAFDVVLWCRNIFDTNYDVDKRDWPSMVPGPQQYGVVDGAPRTVGIDLTWRF